jgi:hypothetical protein
MERLIDYFRYLPTWTDFEMVIERRAIFSCAVLQGLLSAFARSDKLAAVGRRFAKERAQGLVSLFFISFTQASAQKKLLSYGSNESGNKKHCLLQSKATPSHSALP